MQKYIAALQAVQALGIIQDHITSISFQRRRAYFEKSNDVVDIQIFVKYRPSGLTWELTEDLWYVSRQSININGQQFEISIHNR
jgi:hypothetical protein